MTEFCQIMKIKSQKFEKKNTEKKIKKREKKYSQYSPNNKIFQFSKNKKI